MSSQRRAAGAARDPGATRRWRGRAGRAPPNAE